MASAETQKMSGRKKCDSVPRVENDFRPNNRPEGGNTVTSARPVRQLDFYQAMSDFKTMFPTMDGEVIEAVLRANDGAVDSTIDQLLTMSIDNEDDVGSAVSDLTEPYSPDFDDSLPKYEPQRTEDSPPSYHEAVHSPQNFWTTPISGASQPPNKSKCDSSPNGDLLCLQNDELSLSNTEPKTPIFDTTDTSAKPSSKKFSYQIWNPPLLGRLPDDFLRLPLSSPSRQVVPNSNVNNNTCSYFENVPKIVSSGGQRCKTLTVHDFSSTMLKRKMKENERRRQTISHELEPEFAQYLEDERLAIMFQNTEFLQELRDNEDFMKTLEKERLNASAFETVPDPEKLNNSTEIPLPENSLENQIEGYGDDRQQTLEAFPFSQPAPYCKADDAELCRQLSHMGKASKKQFVTLAKKFFSRKKKKSSKQILREKLAPSMVNLLDTEEIGEESDPPIDRSYADSPHIEPLPSSLPSVPSHRTVQRPPYHPETVVTYHDSRHDMV